MRLRQLRAPGRLLLAAGTSAAARRQARRRCPARARARSSRPRTSGTGPSTDLPVAANSAAHDQRDRARRARPSRLRLLPRLRHPVQRRLEQEGAQGARLVRLRRRVRQGRLPDAGASAAGRRRRRARPDRRQGRLPALRAVRGARERRQLEGRLGRRLEPALQPPAPGLVDVAPTRPACRSCPAWCATTRSQRASSGTRCASPPSARARRTSTRPATTPAIPTPRCRRWACACGSRPRSTSRATASRRASSCRRSRPTG